MKKNLLLLVLFISTYQPLFAQQNADKTFEIPANSVERIFFIDLEKGEKIKFELGSLDDLDVVGNIDSVLRVFIQDIEPLKDSLVNELTSKRIDYIIDPTGKNKIRIQQFAPNGSSYLVNQGAVAAMKLEQDTLNIIFKANGGPGSVFKKTGKGYHFYRISFYINSITNLAGYMDGRLPIAINQLKENATKKFVHQKDGMMHSKAVPAIYSSMPRGQLAGGDYLSLGATADIQNYKNYFVPSLSLRVMIVTNRNTIKREYSFTGESHFSFERNSLGKLQTFRNSFLTLGFNQYNLGEKKSIFGLTPSFSFGWLARQRGNMYEKNTFRIGFGKAMIGNTIKVEPVIYFNDFFKGVTPGLRVSL